MGTSTSTMMMDWRHPIAYFVAGMLVPISYFFVARRRNDNDDDDESYDDESYDDESDNDHVDYAQTRLVDVGNPSESWGLRDAPFKMVLCVNTSLGMGKGKIAAQCGHAAVGCYKRARKQCPKALSAWETTGCAKIAVKCPTEEEMHAIGKLARSKGIPIYLVEDAGRTQIAAGSQTVLGMGPAPVWVFEDVTSHLKLM